jgi:hypothetical protein
MRDIFNKHNDIVNRLRQKLAEADREGEGRPQWKLERRAAALDEAKKASTSLRVDLKITTANKSQAAHDVFNETRKGGAKTKPAPSEALLWRQQAALLNGLEPKQAIPRYSHMLSKLTPDEKLAWRYVFDDALELAVFGDPALEFQAAQVINQNRTPDEKAALKAMQKAERFEDFVPTLTAIFETNLKEAEDGDKQANDPAVVFDTINNDIDAEFAKL